MPQKNDGMIDRLITNLSSPLRDVRLRATCSLLSKIELKLISEQSLLNHFHYLIAEVLKSINEFHINGDTEGLPELIGLLTGFLRSRSGRKIAESYGVIDFFVSFYKHCQREGFIAAERLAKDFVSLAIHGKEASTISEKVPEALSRKDHRNPELVPSLPRLTCFALPTIELSESDRSRILRLTAGLRLLDTVQPSTALLEELFIFLDNADPALIFTTATEVVFAVLRLITQCQDALLALRLWGAICSVLESAVREAQVREAEKVTNDLSIESVYARCTDLIVKFTVLGCPLLCLHSLKRVIEELSHKGGNQTHEYMAQRFGILQKQMAQKELNLSLEQQQAIAMCETDILLSLPLRPAYATHVDFQRTVIFTRRGFIPAYRLDAIRDIFEKVAPDLLPTLKESEQIQSMFRQLHYRPSQGDIVEACSRSPVFFTLLDREEMNIVISLHNEAVRRNFLRYFCLAFAVSDYANARPSLLSLLSALADTALEQLMSLSAQGPLTDMIILASLENGTAEVRYQASALIRLLHASSEPQLLALYSVALYDKALQGLCTPALINLFSFFAAECRTRMHAFSKFDANYRAYDIFEGLLDDKGQCIFSSELDIYKLATRPTPVDEEELRLLLNLLTNGGNASLDKAVRVEALEQIALAVAQGCDRLAIVAANFLSDRVFEESDNSVLLPMVLCILAFLRLPNQKSQQLSILSQMQDRMSSGNFSSVKNLLLRARGESKRFRLHILGLIQFLLFDLNSIVAKVGELMGVKIAFQGSIFHSEGFVSPLFFEGNTCALVSMVPMQELAIPTHFAVEEFVGKEAEGAMRFLSEANIPKATQKVCNAFVTLYCAETLTGFPAPLLSVVNSLLIQIEQLLEKTTNQDRAVLMQCLLAYFSTLQYSNFSPGPTNNEKEADSSVSRPSINSSSNELTSRIKGKEDPTLDNMRILYPTFITPQAASSLSRVLLRSPEESTYTEHKVALELYQKMRAINQVKAEELVARFQPLHVFSGPFSRFRTSYLEMRTVPSSLLEVPATNFTQKALCRALMIARRTLDDEKPVLEISLKALALAGCPFERVQIAAFQLIVTALRLAKGEERLLLARRCRPLAESIHTKTSGFLQATILHVLALLAVPVTAPQSLRISPDKTLMVGMYARWLRSDTLGQQAPAVSFWLSAIERAPPGALRAFLLGEVAQLFRSNGICADEFFAAVDFNLKARSSLEVTAALSILKLIGSAEEPSSCQSAKGLQLVSHLLPDMPDLLYMATSLAQRLDSVSCESIVSAHTISILVKRAFTLQAFPLLTALLNASSSAVNIILHPTLITLLVGQFGQGLKEKSLNQIQDIFALLRSLFSRKQARGLKLSPANVDCLAQLADTLHKWFVMAAAAEECLESEVLKVLEKWICNSEFEPYFDFKHGLIAQILSIVRAQCDSASVAPFLSFLAKAAVAPRMRAAIFRVKLLEHLVGRLSDKTKLIDRRSEASERFSPMFELFTALSFDPLSLRRLCASAAVFDIYESIFVAQTRSRASWLILFANFALVKSFKPFFFGSKKALKRIELLLVESDDALEVCLCSQFFYNMLFKDTGLLAEVESADLERKMGTVLKEKERQWDRLHTAANKEENRELVKLTINNIVAIRNILLAV